MLPSAIRTAASPVFRARVDMPIFNIRRGHLYAGTDARAYAFVLFGIVSKDLPYPIEIESDDGSYCPASLSEVTPVNAPARQLVAHLSRTPNRSK